MCGFGSPTSWHGLLWLMSGVVLGSIFPRVSAQEPLFVNPSIHFRLQYSTPTLIWQSTESPFQIISTDLDQNMFPDFTVPLLQGEKLFWIDVSQMSEPGFSPLWITAPGLDQPQAVLDGDLDNDGDPDLLVGSSDPTGLRWFENMGGEPLAFDPHALVSTSMMVVDLDLADIDSDGDSDILFLTFGDGRLSWLENTGADPSLYPLHVAIDGLVGPTQFEVADLNQDDLPDLVVIDYDSSSLYWYANAGGPTPGFTQHSIADELNYPTELAAVDFDRDGDLDLMISTRLGPSLLLFENDGTTHPQLTEKILDPTFRDGGVLLAADLDFDQDVDLILGERSNDQLLWYEKINSGLTAHTIWSDVNNLQDATFEDVDGDGLQDIVYVSLGDQKIAWLKNIGGHFASVFSDVAALIDTEPGELVFLMTIEVEHLGELNDTGLILSELLPRVLGQDGNPLTSIEFNDTVAGFYLFRENNGNATWDLMGDSIVAAWNNPTIMGNGEVTLLTDLAEPLLSVNPAEKIRLYLAMEIEDTTEDSVFDIDFNSTDSLQAVDGVELNPLIRAGVTSSTTRINVDYTPPILAEAWVDFSWLGPFKGSFDEPFATLGDALAVLAEAGTIWIKTGEGVEGVRIAAPVRLEAYGGPVRISGR